MNYDFFIFTVDTGSIHFSYDGCFQVHHDENDRIHFKDMEAAIAGYTAMKKIFDMTKTAT